MSKSTIEELMADLPLGSARWICSRECIDFHRACYDEMQHAYVEDAAQYGKPGKWRVTYRVLSGGSRETHIDKIGDHDRSERRDALVRDVRRLADEARELGLDYLGVELAGLALTAMRTRQAAIRIEQPVGLCDGSGKYAWNLDDGERGRDPLAEPCPGCRACK